MSRELDSAQLFVPGRSSYLEADGDGGTQLQLSEGSKRRAMTAMGVFEEDFHTSVLFSGGYPGIAQHWSAEQTPPLGRREADLMARPLEKYLSLNGWSDIEIANRVKRQGESNNSIGDVRVAMERGYLNPDNFHSDNQHAIELVTGAIHGARFKFILAAALGIDRSLIRRIPMRDIYGIPPTEHSPGENGPKTIVEGIGAIAITWQALRNVRPGNVNDLAEAEDHFNALASKLT